MRHAAGAAAGQAACADNCPHRRQTLNCESWCELSPALQTAQQQQHSALSTGVENAPRPLPSPQHNHPSSNTTLDRRLQKGTCSRALQETGDAVAWHLDHLAFGSSVGAGC